MNTSNNELKPNTKRVTKEKQATTTTESKRVNKPKKEKKEPKMKKADQEKLWAEMDMKSEYKEKIEVDSKDVKHKWDRSIDFTLEEEG